MPIFIMNIPVAELKITVNQRSSNILEQVEKAWHISFKGPVPSSSQPPPPPSSTSPTKTLSTLPPSSSNSPQPPQRSQYPPVIPAHHSSASSHPHPISQDKAPTPSTPQQPPSTPQNHSHSVSTSADSSQPLPTLHQTETTATGHARGYLEVPYTLHVGVSLSTLPMLPPPLLVSTPPVLYPIGHGPNASGSRDRQGACQWPPRWCREDLEGPACLGVKMLHHERGG
ncbi:hypothetical protein BC829DRAFT_68406 [Chytridium lagenaria]|nr:hypothetical protein BC829DRAFT_68406 [Chytridium lagenaria]